MASPSIKLSSISRLAANAVAQSTQQQPPKPETPQAIYVDSEAYFSIYCNNTEMSVSPWDIRIKLMEIVGNEGKLPLIKGHGTVVMPPIHGKSLLTVLESTIQKYEDTFGSIDLTKVHEAIQAASR